MLSSCLSQDPNFHTSRGGGGGGGETIYSAINPSVLQLNNVLFSVHKKSFLLTANEILKEGLHHVLFMYK